MKNPAEHIRALRNDYQRKNLEKTSAGQNPFALFEIWMTEAITEAVDEPNAMVLATASAGGKPSARIVLLRGFDKNGFVFFTNYDSRKGLELAENPQASLLFYWAKLERQIRIEGAVSKASRQLSEDYFATRPRASQIGAWASAQSRAIEDRRALEEKFSEAEKSFAGREVACPEFWGGFLLKPNSFEFWQGRQSRLHDRLLYSKKEADWEIERLSP